jgi:hypothetical protein
MAFGRSTDIKEKVNDEVQIEFAEDNLAKPQVKTDYSGAREKTDPAEIALVKKLDRWIMPMLWSMYWLNYLDRNAIALARLNRLEKELNLVGSRKSSIPKNMNHFR